MLFRIENNQFTLYNTLQEAIGRVPETNDPEFYGLRYVVRETLPESPNRFVWYQHAEQPVIENNQVVVKAERLQMDLSVAKDYELESLNDLATEKLEGITSTYPQVEINSWPKQEVEARAFLADNSAPAPMLRALALSRGDDPTYLAQRILYLADAFANMSGKILGNRQRLEKLIDASQSIEDLLAIDYSAGWY